MDKAASRIRLQQMYSYCHAKGQLLQAKEAQNDELECRRSSKNR